MQEIIKKDRKAVKDFIAEYEEKYPGLMSANIGLQEKALELLQGRMEEANPLQLATIYGILADKAANAMKAKSGGGGQTINMFFGENISRDDQIDLMTTVALRMKEEKKAARERKKAEKEAAVEAEFEVVSKPEEPEEESEKI